MTASVIANMLLFSALAAPAAASAQGPAPATFLIAPETMARAHAHPTPELLRKVRKEADDAMKVPALSVTDKSKTPPTGDKHDYMSMARYFWPNPDTPNHLPYIRKDGQTNPEIREVEDLEHMEKMAHSAHALALGYYFTGDKRYAEHAAMLLRAWFLEPATAMKPNLEFAQYIPGVNTGRGAGILDGRRLIYAAEASSLLAGSPAWSAREQEGMHDWFAQYDTWLTTSPHGQAEAKAPNNHGTWYAVQAAAIASFLGRTDDVKRIGERVRTERIPSQFDNAGMQKFEMVRTNSFSYSAFNLEAQTQLAEIVRAAGVDLYAPAPGLLTGLDALLPYDAQHKWPHAQISEGREDSLCPALFRVAAHTHAAKYAEAERRFGCEPTVESEILAAAAAGQH